MFGLINVNKPCGPTSHDVVDHVRRLLPRRSKVGHAGTLDPQAEGVLVICVGPAVRLAECVSDQPKQYVAEVAFGATSTTDDVEGDITPSGAALPTEGQVRTVLPEFIGEIQQVPPAYSAVHVKGRRAHDLARAGIAPQIEPRTVRVDAIELLSMEGDRTRLRIDCGKGTYIRALARDLGRRLGCGAYCSALTRTRVGAFTLDQAVPMDSLTRANLNAHLLPARLAVADWPTVTAGEGQQGEIAMGRAIPSPLCPTPPAVAVLDPAGRLLALCDGGPDNMLRPRKVFIESE